MASAPEEILDGEGDGMLDLERDPKLAWALRNRALFPIDVNRAPRETLLRVPGIGARVAKRILAARRHVTLRIDDLRASRAVARRCPSLCRHAGLAADRPHQLRVASRLRLEPAPT